MRLKSVFTLRGWSSAGGLREMNFSGSDIDRLLQVEPVCSWPQQYYSVTEMLVKISRAREVLEVGVAYGLHALHLLTTNSSINYTGVDPYIAGYDSSDSFASDVAHIFDSAPQVAMDRLHDAVVARLSTEFGDRSRVVRMDSVSASALFPDQSLDLIFIDGDHQYDSVLQDLNVWYPRLRSGGLLAGDDYAWPAVKEAVSTFSDQMGVPVAVIQSIKSAHPLFIMSAGN